MKKEKNSDFGSIKLGKMKKDYVCKFDAEIESLTYNALIEYAKKNIFEDAETLISWAVTDILRKQIEKEKTISKKTLKMIDSSVKNFKKIKSQRK